MLVFVNCSCTHLIILVWIVVACKLSYKSPVWILALAVEKSQYSKLLLHTTNEMATEVDSWHTARINEVPDVQRSYDANTWFTCCVQEHPSIYVWKRTLCAKILVPGVNNFGTIFLHHCTCERNDEMNQFMRLRRFLHYNGSLPAIMLENAVGVLLPSTH